MSKTLQNVVSGSNGSYRLEQALEVASDWKLDPEDKRLWVEALRSGDYKQGHGHLKIRVAVKDDKEICEYCCIGVFAELKGVQNTLRPANNVYEFTFEEHAGFTAYVAYNVLPEKIQTFLALVNDEGVSFPEIADWIEENL